MQFGLAGLLGLCPAGPGRAGELSEPRRGFEDATAASGIDFRHRCGRSPERYLPEIFGSGAAFLDYDGDGRLDLYLVNSGPLKPGSGEEREPNRLYRGEGAGHFTDVTDVAGVGDTGVGMGAVAGDYDGDGDLDLYVTNYGPNVLYRNDGGHFTDVTDVAGVAGDAWSTSAAFGDLDGDGDLDLYVANYLDFRPETNKPCTFPLSPVRTYCHPRHYNGVADVLYRNDGGGRFTDRSRQAGVQNALEGKGLGVLLSDLDGDGHLDIYVANDTMRNFLYRGRGDGSFEDIGFAAGVGYDGAGKAQGGMGVDAADVDGDGDLDLLVTNYEGENNVLYRNLAPGLFEERAATLGLARDTGPLVGFGAAFLDYDHDGWEDLAISNGHILDNLEERHSGLSAHQPGLLYRNLGGRFQEVGGEEAPALRRPRLGRGLAVGDVDGDGDLDLCLTENCGRAVLLENVLAGPDRHWLQVRLEGAGSNRHAVGAQVRVLAGGRWQLREASTGGSYLSHHARTLHFGLGTSSRYERLEVRWPDGTEETRSGGPADRVIVLRQGGAAR